MNNVDERYEGSPTVNLSKEKQCEYLLNVFFDGAERSVVDAIGSLNALTNYETS